MMESAGIVLITVAIALMLISPVHLTAVRLRSAHGDASPKERPAAEAPFVADETTRAVRERRHA